VLAGRAGSDLCRIRQRGAAAILFCCHDLQAVRIAAMPELALVIRLVPFRDRAFQQLPRETMR